MKRKLPAVVRPVAQQKADRSSSVSAGPPVKPNHRSITRRRSPESQRIQRGGFFYESTRYEDCNLNGHFAYADDGSADAHASEDARRESRNRARFELANNGWLSGMGRTLKNDLVGTCPRRRTTDERLDEGDRERLDKLFRQWCRDVQFARKLRCIKLAQKRDGEGLAIIHPIEGRAGQRFRNPVKVGFRVFDCDRLDDYFGESVAAVDGDDFVQGIRYDEYGEPLEYRLLKVHPGDDRAFPDLGANPYNVVPAENVVHLFDLTRPEQSRGVTEFQPSTHRSALARQYEQAVVKSARNQARFTPVIETNLPPTTETIETDDEEISIQDRCEPGTTFDLHDDQLTTLPDAYSAKNLQASQPIATHQEFVHSNVDAIGRGPGLPSHKARGNSSEASYASARMDHQDYWSDINVERSEDEERALDKVYVLWFEAALLVEDYLPESVRSLIGPTDHPPIPEGSWEFDQSAHVDPDRESRAQERRLKNGTTTLSREWNREGADARQALREEAELLGITVEELQQHIIRLRYGEPKENVSDRERDRELESALDRLEELEAMVARR